MTDTLQAGVRPMERLTPREQQIAVLGSWNQVGHVIYVLGELRVADHLAAGPLPVEELAASTQSDASALYRVLRCAEAVGIVAKGEDGCFGLTALGEGLRSDRLGGLRPMVLFSAADFVRLPYAEILHSVRTGQPAFDRVFGMSFYAYLEAHPEVGQDFERFLAHWSRQLSERFAGQLALRRFRTVADVGGGDGYFLATLLRDHAEVSGTLFDLAPVAARARTLLAEHGLADRVTVVGGDFFSDPLPPGCDAYILKSIVHNWPDQQARAILRRVRQAIGDGSGRLIAIDQVVPAGSSWDHAKVIDIDMLVLFGGMERDLEEWNQLFAATGFELVNQPGDGWTLLECRPV
jgi:hypothetical protein